MTQEQKSLLLLDLCARLPYGIMVLEDIDKEFDGGCISKLVTITEIKGEKMFITKSSLTPVSIEEICPYLRPMSSMTEEEIEELNNLVDKELKDSEPYFVYEQLTVDFYLRHHLDNRLMIEKDLALPAPEGMYK